MSLILKKINITYDKKIIISNLDASFERGKLYVIIGKNGSGKTTLLRSIVGSKDIESGEILLDDLNIREYKKKDFAQKIAYLSQIHPNILDLDVETIVSLGRYPYYKFNCKIDNRVNEAIKKFKLEEFRKVQYNKISGGEKQRVWLAMIYAQQSNYILLDEPTTYLDINNQIELLDYLKKMVKEENCCIIIILHDLNLAAKYADYIYLLDKNNFIFEGKPVEIINEKNLKEVFNLNCKVIINDNKPFIIF